MCGPWRKKGLRSCVVIEMLFLLLKHIRSWCRCANSSIYEVIPTLFIRQTEYADGLEYGCLP